MLLKLLCLLLKPSLKEIHRFEENIQLLSVSANDVVVVELQLKKIAIYT